jgi:hypothetical protein
VGVDISIFMTSAQAGAEWPASYPGRFTPGERAPDRIGGWVGPRAGQEGVEKILDYTGTRTPTPRQSSP